MARERPRENDVKDTPSPRAVIVGSPFDVVLGTEFPHQPRSTVVWRDDERVPSLLISERRDLTESETVDDDIREDSESVVNRSTVRPSQESRQRR